MIKDFESGNIIGKGEESTFNILKMLTGLSLRSLKHFPFSDGIYRQLPIAWILQPKEFKQLSEAHQKGSIDLYIKVQQINIAIRIQGKGHGTGLKGLGKAQHDKIQKQILQKYCQVVDVNQWECKEIFKEKTNNLAIQEVINAFKTDKVMMPCVKKI